MYSHLPVKNEFISSYYLWSHPMCSNRVKFETHPHTLTHHQTRFHWNVTLTSLPYKRSLWLRTRKRSKSSTKVSWKVIQKKLQISDYKEPAEWVLDFTLSSVSARGIWFTTQVPTWLSLLDIWSRCFVTYKKWHIPHTWYTNSTQFVHSYRATQLWR